MFFIIYTAACGSFPANGFKLAAGDQLHLSWFFSHAMQALVKLNRRLHYTLKGYRVVFYAARANMSKSHGSMRSLQASIGVLGYRPQDIERNVRHVNSE